MMILGLFLNKIAVKLYLIISEYIMIEFSLFIIIIMRFILLVWILLVVNIVFSTQVVVDYNKEPYQALRDVLGKSGI